MQFIVFFCFQTAAAAAEKEQMEAARNSTSGVQPLFQMNTGGDNFASLLNSSSSIGGNSKNGLFGSDPFSTSDVFGVGSSSAPLDPFEQDPFMPIAADPFSPQVKG